jgi:hypothetical protein
MGEGVQAAGQGAKEGDAFSTWEPAGSAVMGPMAV